MNRLKQTGLIVTAMCVGCVLLIGSAWMAERPAAQSYGPAVGNTPSGPYENLPHSNKGDDYPENSPHGVEPERKPIPEGESVWEDYDDVQDSPRFKERPGNYPALLTIYDFLDGQYQVKPEFRRVAFPLFLNSSTPIADEATLKSQVGAAEDSARQRGKKLRNKERRYNFIVKELLLLEIPDLTAISWNEVDGVMEKSKQKMFGKVSEAHKGRAQLVRLKMHLESLRSDKIEGSEEKSYSWLLLVFDGSEWKVVWYDK